MSFLSATFPPASVARSFDVFERVMAATLFAFLCSRMAQPILDEADLFYILIVVVELSIVCFMVFRRFAETITLSPRDWFIAALGTSLPTLAIPGDPAPLVPEVVSGFLMVLGFILQIHGKFTLNRSFGIVAANRGVKTSGPYVIVRHPIYLGYTLTHLGFVLYAPNYWNAAIYGLTFAFQVLRILAEERLLAADPSYRALSEKVRYRLVPGLF